MTITDLPQILAAHGKWLRDEEGGRRADLCTHGIHFFLTRAEAEKW